MAPEVTGGRPRTRGSAAASATTRAPGLPATVAVQRESSTGLRVPREPGARPAPPTMTWASPISTTCADGTPSSRAVNSVSRCRARDPRAVSSNRRTAARRPSGELTPVPSTARGRSASCWTSATGSAGRPRRPCTHPMSTSLSLMNVRSRTTYVSERTAPDTGGKTWRSPAGGVTPHAAGGRRRPQDAGLGVSADRREPAQRPLAGDGDVVAAAAQLRDDVVPETGLDHHLARCRVARVERRREARRVPGRGVDRGLQVQPTERVGEPEAQLPLLLLVAARRAEGEGRNAAAQGQGGREGGPRALARRQRVGQARLEPEHLRPGTQGEAELGDHRRALQPAPRRGGGDEIAPPVHDVDVAGVTAGPAQRVDGRFSHARAGMDVGGGRAGGDEGGRPGRPPTGGTGPQLAARGLPDERPPLGGV